MQRTLRLEGVLNARDLGGLATRDGRRVAPGLLYRSGSLHSMRGADRATLESLQIGTVIDLRSGWERRRDPYDWPRGRVVHAPLIGDDLVASIHARFDEGTLTEEELVDWWGLTRVPQSLETHGDSIRLFFETLLEGTGEATLYHCTVGKDRAGLVTALLLRCLGVTGDEVAADFALSNVQLAHLADDLARRNRTSAGRPLSRAALHSLTGVRPEWLGDLLRSIDDRFGSVDAYLTERVGLQAGALAGLRGRYLRDG